MNEQDPENQYAGWPMPTREEVEALDVNSIKRIWARLGELTTREAELATVIRIEDLRKIRRRRRHQR